MPEMQDADHDPSTQPAPIDPMAYYFQDILLLNRSDAVRLYLVRHGESASNVARREGRPSDYDPPLTATGEEQARRLGERLARSGIDAVYSSPLQRSYNTGVAIARLTGHDITVVDDLQEINEPARRDGVDIEVTPPEGVSYDEIKRRFEQEPTWDNLPGGESSVHFRMRISGAISRIVEDNPGKRVAITCHGGVIQSYIGHILGLQSDFAFYCFNASITSVRAAGDRRVLWRLNDLAHLEGMRMT